MYRQFLNETNSLVATILEADEVVYHGNNRSDLVLKERPITNDFQSMGTWFSDSQKYAKMFGKNIHSLPLPKGKFLKPKKHRFADVFFDKDVSKKLYGKRITDLLAKYAKAWTKSPRRESNWNDDDDDYVDNKLVSDLKVLGINYRGSTSGSEPFRQLIFSNSDYIQLLRWKLDSKYDGIHFKNSKIDIPQTHDVYLIFNPNKIKNWKGMKNVSSILE